MRLFDGDANVVQFLEYDNGALKNHPPIIFMEVMTRGNLRQMIETWNRVRHEFSWSMFSIDGRVAHSIRVKAEKLCEQPSTGIEVLTLFDLLAHCRMSLQMNKQVPSHGTFENIKTGS
jgi:hypothetical protein